MTRRIGRLALFAVFALLTILAPLVPVAPGVARVPPDLLFCIVLIWVLHAPDAAPVWAILGLGLLADTLLMRPPGLGALGLLLASEVARSRGPMLRGIGFGYGFIGEWLAVAVLFALVTLVTQLFLHLTLAPGANWSAAVGLVAITAISYGPLALALGWLLRLTGPRRGAESSRGAAA